MAKKSVAPKKQATAGHLTGGKHLEQELDQLYISRKSRGNPRSSFNEHIDKIPGHYNERGSIEV